MPWTKPFGKLFRSFSLLFSDSRASLLPALKDGGCARQNLINPAEHVRANGGRGGLQIPQPLGIVPLPAHRAMRGFLGDRRRAVFFLRAAPFSAVFGSGVCAPRSARRVRHLFPLRLSLPQNDLAREGQLPQGRLKTF